MINTSTLIPFKPFLFVLLPSSSKENDHKEKNGLNQDTNSWPQRTQWICQKNTTARFQQSFFLPYRFLVRTCESDRLRKWREIPELIT